ncbi:hypothetical protein IWQ62_005684 [Dispira parvispora]|uniref:Copper acquisition factor BIM1-like domain-containing protein n=1 Tax=Dispira parvispora TaxID=1520584 RepID=A0A9W8AJ94_9FUNG|nr:hypothetical protein IWQ62_005684 [Dispira parvispora]
MKLVSFLTVLSAGVALVAAQSESRFIFQSPKSRGQDPGLELYWPCGGYTNATTETQIKPKEDVSFTVPADEKGLVTLFYLPLDRTDVDWRELGNVTVTGTSTTLNTTIDFNGKAYPNSKGLLQAVFFRDDGDLRSKPLYQCADVSFDGSVQEPNEKADNNSASTISLGAVLVGLAAVSSWAQL